MQYRTVAKITWLRPQALQLERTEFKSWLFHLTGVWPYVSYLMLLWFSCRKMVEIIHAFKDCLMVK